MPFTESVQNFLKKRIAYESYTADQKRVIKAVQDSLNDAAIQEKQHVIAAQHKEGTHVDLEDAVNSEPSISSNLSVGKNRLPDGTEIVYISFEEGDPENPFNWSPLRKGVALFVILVITLVGGIAGASLSSGVSTMTTELHTVRELAVLGFSIYILGFAVGPLPLSPIGEEYGRYMCYTVGIFAMLIFAVPVAVTDSIAVVIVFRMLGGTIGSVSSSMTGGSIADVFKPHERGIPMLAHTVMNFAANVIAPVAFGYLSWLRDFRWIKYIFIILCGVALILMFLFMQETRGNVILQSRANRLQKEEGGPDLVFLVAGKEYISLHHLIQRTIFRPVVFFWTEPVITYFSLWMGFTWGCMYIQFQAVPLVMQNVYGMNPGESSLVFIAELVGIFIGSGIELYQQRLYEKYKSKRGPEARLFTCGVGGFFCFAGLMIFAFSEGEGHWIGPAAGLAVLLTGVFSIFQAVTLYFADCYETYSSSALAVQSLTRNLCGFSFPLFTTQMYNGLSYRWASFLAAMVALLLGFVPFWLFIYGPRLRQKSKYIALKD